MINTACNKLQHLLWWYFGGFDDGEASAIGCCDENEVL
jgi:hypothetical protein